MAITESREIVIEASKDEILDVLFDIEKLPEWSPTHKKVVVLERDDEGRPSKAKESVKVVGIGEDQVLAYTVYDDGVGWELVSAKNQRAQDGRYVLTPKGDSTNVRFTLTVDLTIPVPGFLLKQGAKGLMDTATKGLRKRVLQVKKGK